MKAVRVAALYDIHGNLPALDAALAEIRRERVDLIVVGGDAIIGQDSAAVVRRLTTLDVPTRFISGNCERVVLADLAGGDISEVPAAYLGDVHRTAAEMDDECLRAIRSWPPTCEVTIDGLGDVFFCHATARNDREIFNAQTPDADVAPMFERVAAPLVVCGHTHVQFDRTLGSARLKPSRSLRIVNAGSVGMPFAPPPGAHWLLIGPDVELRQTAY
jgi:predicted phosphodiesterase